MIYNRLSKLMGKGKNLVLLLLAIIIVLLLVDIGTGIWYYNRPHLSFSPSNFNNIATPIIGIISIGIYSLALFISAKQTLIIQSQNLKPHFERDFERLKKEGGRNIYED